MASFTMELWRVLDGKPENKTEAEWVGLSEYPLFEGDYREGLNRKILDHFMYQEIGFETVDQFRFAMKRRMNEVMPYFNQLYKSTQITFDPLLTMDIRTVATGSSEQISEGETNNATDTDVDATAKNVASAFPQVQLSGNKDYATSGADSNSQTKSKATAKETAESSNTAKNNDDSRTSGYQGNPATLLQEFRAAIVNVDMLLISALDDLFMIVWQNSDEYSRTKGRFFY